MRKSHLLLGVVGGIVLGKLVFGTEFVAFKITEPLQKLVGETLGTGVFETVDEPELDAEGFE